ncbi:MAG: hypothetical protein MI806_25865 [Minwuiales bacterium]|nr:hypothetical protein [Minwuiales bacterium]
MRLLAGRGLFAVLGIAALAACGTMHFGPTGYVKADPTWGSRYGYSDKTMGSDEYSVVVHGNPKTSKRRAAELALLRAAHLTLEQERTHFSVVAGLAHDSDAETLISVPLFPAVIVPVAQKTRQEPVAVLVVRLLPADAAPATDALAADMVIRLLEQLKQ